MSVYKDKEKTKDGKQWRYKCYKKDVTGNKVQVNSKRYTYKWEAEEAERIFLLKRDNPLHKELNIVAVDYFEYLKTIKKDSTYYTYTKEYDRHIRPYFEHNDIDSINIQQIREWHLEMNKKGLSVKYKNKIYTVFKNILDYAVKNYGLERNVVQIFGRFQRKNDEIVEDKKRYITLEEFNEFISFVDEPLWHCWFITAFYTGCRLGELQVIRWNDIDFINNNITINKTLSKIGTITSTKTNQNRTIKMNKTLIEELLTWQQYVKQYSDYQKDWFVFGSQVPLPATTIARYKHKYFQLSNIPEITMHEFRHSAVSLLLNKMLESDVNLDINKALIILSSRFGHSPEVMIRTYGHLYEDKLQEPIVDILDSL